MKKAIIVLSIALAVAACDKLSPVIEITSENDSVVTFNISVESNETKAVKSEWANGDKIYVFFEGLAEKWLELTYDGSIWSAEDGNGTFVAGDFSALGTKELTAVHLPVDATVTYANSKFSFRDASDNPIYTFYLYEANKAYTVDGTTVTANLSIGKPADYVWFHVAGIEANADQYYLKESNLLATACDYVNLDGGVTEKETAGHVLVPVADADGAMYAAKGTSLGVSTTYNFQLIKVHDASDMIAEATYTRTVASKNLAAGKQVNLNTPLAGSDWTLNKWVDLGFATNNVAWGVGNLVGYNTIPETYGVGTPENLGRFFYWAGTEDHKSGYGFGFANAPYYDSELSQYTKYTNTDSKTVLESSDDAANVLLGDGWRLPTADEMSNLEASYNSPATYNEAGGFTFDGPCGVSLFIVKNGYVNGSTGKYSAGATFIWTSNVADTKTSGKYMRVSFGDTPVAEIRPGQRQHGMGVRPVKDI